MEEAKEVERLKTQQAREEADLLRKELSEVEHNLSTKDKELMASKTALKLNSEATAKEQRKLLTTKESQSQEVALQLQYAEQKIVTCESHIEHLGDRIKSLEEELTRSAKEKKEILANLKKKELEVDHVNMQVVHELKSQLREETSKLRKVAISIPDTFFNTFRQVLFPQVNCSFARTNGILNLIN